MLQIQQSLVPRTREAISMINAPPSETTNIKEIFKESEQQYKEFDLKLDFVASLQAFVDDSSYGYEKPDLLVIYRRLLMQPQAM